MKSEPQSDLSAFNGEGQIGEDDLLKFYRLEKSGISKPEAYEIVYNPLADLAKKEPAQRGSFGPFPLRTKMDKVLYGCGIAYIIGLSTGGIYGTLLSLKSLKGNSFSVWHTMFMNQTTRYGPALANGISVLALGWSILDNLMETVRGKSDYYNHIPAAFLTGAIYKSTAGVRPAFVAGSIFASLITTYGIVDSLALPIGKTQETHHQDVKLALN